jgi:tetratricopeptide (TPR) repeat protein
VPDRLHLPSADPDRTAARSASVEPDATVVAADGSTGPRPADPPAGAPSIPGYAITAEIARGGMGRVYAAVDLTLDREVAVKTLLPGADPSRFVTESKITARLPHPNIPPVHALGELADGTPFLAMKLVRGATLAEQLKSRPSPAHHRPRFVQVFEQIAQAVGFAHTRGIIHRDLKPANVMVGEFGEVQVMDWGLAKVLGERRDGSPPVDASPAEATGPHPPGTDLTRAGAVMGTPAYMAPEQARGEAVDARADVFALGSTLAAVLTGRPAFAGTTAGETVARAARADLADVLARLDACGADAELVGLAKRCLAARPEDRPADGRAVAGEVAAYLAGVEGRLRQAEIGTAEANERARAERRSRRVQLVAAVLLLLVLAAGTTGTAVGLVKARRAQEQAEFAEGEEKKRADELQKVSGFQARMLRQADAADAGTQLMADLRARHAAALEQGKSPAAAQAARRAAFERELAAVNGTDAAVAMLDRTVLAPAVQTVDTEFANQPLVDASLRETLGSVYTSLGRYREALALYRRSYDERRAGLGEDHVDTLAARLGVGTALGELQNLPEAEAAVRAAVEGYERVRGPDHADTLTARTRLASQMRLQGRYDEAVAIGRDILERRRRTQGNDHPDTVDALSDLGRSLILSGKYADAEKVLREVVDAQRKTAHPGLAASLSNLGNALQRQREYAAAEPYFRESLQLRRRAVGEHHPKTLGAMNLLASQLMTVEKLDEAGPLARELLEKCRRAFGDGHASTLAALNITGQILFRQNKYAETEPYYREAMETGRRVLGEDHPDTVIWIANYGSLLQRLGRLGEAEAYFKEALEKNRKQLGETHPYTISLMRNLADVMRQQQKLADAESYLRPLLEAVRRTDGEDHPETIGLYGVLGAVLRDQDKLAEAETCLQKYLDGNRRRYGEDHANTLTAVLLMGSLRVAQERYSDALAVLAPAEGKVTKAMPGLTGVLRNASLIGMIGKCRAKLAKGPADFAAAEGNLLESQSTFAKLRGDKDLETRKATQDLIDFYAAWDKADPGRGHGAKADDWKKRLGATTK